MDLGSPMSKKWWVRDEQDRNFSGTVGRNLCTGPHTIPCWTRGPDPRLPEQQLPPPIRIGQSWHCSRRLDRHSHSRRHCWILGLAKTRSYEDSRTHYSNVREDRLLRWKKIQANHSLLDSIVCCEFSAVSAALPSHHF